MKKFLSLFVVFATTVSLVAGLTLAGQTKVSVPIGGFSAVVSNPTFASKVNIEVTNPRIGSINASTYDGSQTMTFGIGKTDYIYFDVTNTIAASDGDPTTEFYYHVTLTPQNSLTGINQMDDVIVRGRLDGMPVKGTNDLYTMLSSTKKLPINTSPIKTSDTDTKTIVLEFEIPRSVTDISNLVITPFDIDVEVIEVQ